MKKILLTLCVSCCSAVYSQNLNFSDSKFKALILSSTSTNEIAKDLTGNSIAIDANGDGEIQVSEAQQVKILTVELPTFNSSLVPDGISDATQFTNVEELYIYHANSAILNYVNNDKIRKVKYVYNAAVMPSTIAYSFDNCSALQTLNEVITSPSILNSITAQTLTVKNCSQVIPNTNIEGALEELFIENCPIVNLEINTRSDFKKLSVPNMNSLVSINFTSDDNFDTAYQGAELIANNCANLQQVTTAGSYYNNSMVYISSINVNGCTNLKKIKGLNYPNINLSGAGLINLEELDCAFYNRYGYTGSYGGTVTLGNVNSINLAGLPKLKRLLAYNQPITSINFTACPLFEEIDVVNSVCFMTTVDISNLAHLHTFYAYKGAPDDGTLPINLQQINAQNCTALLNLKISGNYDLKNLNLQNCASLPSLKLGTNLPGNSIYDSFSELINLNVKQCASLEELGVTNTKISSLDISDCAGLKKLDLIENNFLNQLNISNNINLEDLHIEKLPLIAQLNTLDNVNLKNVFFKECPLLTQLDFSTASHLESFSALDNSNLVSVNLHNNSIEQYVENYNYNPSLSVCVDDAQLATFVDFDINFTSDCTNLIKTIWNGTTWSNGAPTSAINAFIAGNYSTTTHPSFTAKNITVNKGAVLEITSGNTVNAADVTIKDGGNLIQRDGSSLNYTGTFKVKKYSTSDFNKYAFWSSPVASQALNAIYGTGITPQFITEYNTATDNFVNAVSATSAFGKGYSIKTPSGSIGTVTFTGVPNNGTQTYTLATGGNGFNLIGNPYPSNLDLTTFYNVNSGRVSNTFYFWDNTSNSVTTQSGSSTTNVGYATYNPASQIWTPAPNINVIPTENSVKMGQGFMVKATNAADTSLSFSNDMRVATTGTFFNKNNSATEGKFWLRLNSSYNSNNTFAVAYLSSASDTFDKYDSKAIATGSDAFYTLADAQKLVIQGKSTFDINDAVPVGTKHFDAGSFVISLAQKEGLFDNGQAIYLHDKDLGTYTNLQNANYSFTANAGEFANRFEIVYKLNVLATAEADKDSFEAYRDGEDFFVRNDKNIETVEVFDAAGRKVMHLNPKAKLVRLKLNAKGLYILRAVSAGKEYSKKIMK